MMFERANAHGSGTAVYVGVGGANDVNGNLFLQNTAGQQVIRLQVDGANTGGRITLQDGAGHGVIVLQADGGNVWVGANGAAGAVAVRNGGGLDTITLLGDGGTVQVGAATGGASGGIGIRDGSGAETITLQGDGPGGTVTLQDSSRRNVIVLQANGGTVQVGAAAGGAAGGIGIRDGSGTETIKLLGDGGNITVSGDISLTHADCAEEFDISGGENIEPGTVMVLDEHGKLRQSTEAYDKKVAGVLSGAGEWRPGLVLDKKQPDSARKALALVGKVYCKADAQLSPIQIGDLLTTSATPGHAMKAADPTRAFGAVIGKALSALSCGQGLIPILVALQ
jgi:hypothetical protein